MDAISSISPCDKTSNFDFSYSFNSTAVFFATVLASDPIVTFTRLASRVFAAFAAFGKGAFRCFFSLDFFCVTCAPARSGDKITISDCLLMSIEFDWAGSSSLNISGKIDVTCWSSAT